ncbi:MAG TPA: hypothetical protein VMJ10_15060 [Kofleriaceae bacterium]|nr:hypothetical protein [Kofleriaceae bacterium]
MWPRHALSLLLVFTATCHNSAPPPIGDGGTATTCPQFLDLQLLGTGSRFEPGWNGSIHGIGLPVGSQLSVQITGCDPECRRCSFDGPVRGPGPVISQRCVANTAMTCTSDADCGAPDVCRFMFPPISTPVAGISTCSLAYFEPVSGTDPAPVQGVIDLVTGESTMTFLNLVIEVAEGQNGSCDQCAGDPTPNDGVQGGTCTPGGAVCDTNGQSITGTLAETSFDCAPTPLGLQPIAIPASGASTLSVEWTMDASRPFCTSGGSNLAKQCWCGICSDGTPCTENSQCSDNVCGSAMIGSASFAVNNNSCGGAGCNWDPTTQSGTCSGKNTSCFPDTGSMTATGAAEVHNVPGGTYYISQIADLVCMPSFTGTTGTGTGALIDSVAGFPGPMLFEARFQVNTRSAP